MKLLELTLLYYPSIGGLEKSISDRLRIYRELGIQYKIISTDYDSKTNVGIRDPDVTYLKQYTPYNIIPSLHRYLDDDYDVVNINMIGRYYSDYAIQHFSRTKTKIILTPHSFYHTRKYHLIKRFVEKSLLPYLLKKIHALVVFTQQEKNAWMERYSIDGKKIFVIPHYIETAIQPMEGQQWNNNGSNCIVYIGRARANKLTDLLLKTFCRLKEIDYSLVMTISESDISNDLLSEVRRDKRITLLGYVSEEQKLDLLKNTSGVIFPTSFEAFGYSAFEASTMAKPLLCSDIPVFRELLSPHGVLYFANNEKSLSETLIKFQNLGSDEKKNMGLTNYHHLAEYSYSKSLERYTDLFKSL
ncbi:MAG: glycosyltransferase family 4 protein [Ignavibacteriales bacterium]|nr:glycosyltransferase family 4 protein [Ignavibacteriales bacterium]